jgi:uncharacterized protein
MKQRDMRGANERTRVRRQPSRGFYDRKTIYEILDDALIGHVGFVSDGLPIVIPMVVVRRGDDLLIHGSTASRLTRRLGSGVDICVTVTHLDGVIVARSVFDNSMNYRSVVVFGHARAITDPDEKLEALHTIVEHVLAGRWDEARRPNTKELRATTILELPLEEASAKIRSGPPKDDEADLELPVWAGEIPIRTVSGVPRPDPVLGSDIPVPESVTRFRVAGIPPAEGRSPHPDRRIARVVSAAQAVGLEIETVTFAETTRTAEDAARAIGCDVAQIVKSLIFQSDGRPLLFLVSGANRLDLRRAAAAAEVPTLDKADADLTKRTTGFSIGGVPPFGHATDLPVYIDEDLMRFDVVWAAAGRPDSVFSVDPNVLHARFGGRVIALKAVAD